MCSYTVVKKKARVVGEVRSSYSVLNLKGAVALQVVCSFHLSELRDLQCYRSEMRSEAIKTYT